MSGSQKSLGKGSAPPGPVPEGLIRLYSMRFGPFPQRALLVLAAKGIKHEVVNINIKDKPDWFYEKSPYGLVPSLETPDGKIIYDSPIVCDYLDEAYPGKKLTPADPYEKAQQKMLLEQFSGENFPSDTEKTAKEGASNKNPKVTAALYKIFLAKKDNQDVTELNKQFLEKFKKLDEALAKRKTPYFGGQSITMIDYMIWPWIERLILFDVLECLEKVPHISAWQKLMLQEPAVKATYTEPDVLLHVINLYSQGNLDAIDYGLD